MLATSLTPFKCLLKISILLKAIGLNILILILSRTTMSKYEYLHFLTFVPCYHWFSHPIPVLILQFCKLFSGRGLSTASIILLSTFELMRLCK